MPSSVSAASKSWDGEAGDCDISTPANWSDDVAPVDGDELEFDIDNEDCVDDHDLVLTISGDPFEIAGMLFDLDGLDKQVSVVLDADSLQLSGQIERSSNSSGAIELIDGASVELVGDLDIVNAELTSSYGIDELPTVSVSSYALSSQSLGSLNLTGSGSISIDDGRLYNLTGDYSGQITALGVSTVHLDRIDLPEGEIIIEERATGVLVRPEEDSFVYDGDISLSGSLRLGIQAIGSTSTDLNDVIIDMTGTITLIGDSELIAGNEEGVTVNIDDLVKNGHSLNVENTMATVNINESEAEQSNTVIKSGEGSLDDDRIDLFTGQSLILDGKVSSVVVGSGGVLSGSGEMNGLILGGTGHVNPVTILAVSLSTML